MLAKRIIPCLDVKDGVLTKGIKFKNNVKVGDGDPIKAAKYYSNQGADELVFYDISATPDGNQIMVAIVKKISKTINIPFCVGGGIRNIKDMRKILLAGADKISINSAAVKDPNLIAKGAKAFGSQCIVLGIDVQKNKKLPSGYEIVIAGGRKPMGLDAIEWVKKAEKLGAGEICVNSIDEDGEKKGYDLDLLKKVKQAVKIPVIASGGVGDLEHLAEGAKIADAVLAASIFHYKKYTIPQVKKYLNKKNICIRK